MKRLGCLYIPEFRIQLHLLDEGLPAETPLVLLTRQGQRLVSSAVSPAAARMGVTPGMPLAQVEHACPHARLREEEPERYATAGQALLASLLALTPSVEAVRLGLYFFGTKGLRYLHRDEQALLRAALEQASRLKLTAHAGVAGTRFSAQSAARQSPVGECLIVPPGADRTHLAPLPLGFVTTRPDLLERLGLVGIYTLGDLARLSSRAVERRYGPEGVELFRLARAEDGSHLTPTPLPVSRQAALWLEEPVEQAEGLLFLVAPLLERLLRELIDEGRACAAMRLELTLERGSPVEVPLPLGTAVTQSRPLLDLLRLRLSRVELPAGVTGLLLEATQITEPCTPQGDLFVRTGSPSGMALTLARLTEALGRDAVLTGQALREYDPGRTSLTTPVEEGAPGLFPTVSTPSRRKPTGPRRRKTGTATGRSTQEPSQEPTLAPADATQSPPTLHRSASLLSTARLSTGADRMPPQLSSAPGEKDNAEAEALPMVRPFRQLKPPQPVEVQADPDGPYALISSGKRRQIVQRSGPFRFEGHWWEDAYERDYYEISLGDGIDMLLYQSRDTLSWFIGGLYD